MMNKERKRRRFGRRHVVLVALLLYAAFALSGCKPLVPEDHSLNLYATFYPVYALADALVREVPDVELHCLVQPQDGCLRSYQLSDWDLRLLKASASAVLMGGRGLEDFESTLFGLGENGPAVSAVLYNLPLFNPAKSHANGEGESHLTGANPHLYLSLEGAKQMLNSLSAALMSLDPGYSDRYVDNEREAELAIETLFDQCRTMLAEYAGARVVLMNEALIYVAQDYDLEVADWVDRESGTAFYDVELERCLERLAKSGTKIILIEKQAPQSFCEALEKAGYTLARLDVFSTHREGEGFEAYLDAQRENAEALRAALQLGEET